MPPAIMQKSGADEAHIIFVDKNFIYLKRIAIKKKVGCETLCKK